MKPLVPMRDLDGVRIYMEGDMEASMEEDIEATTAAEEGGRQRVTRGGAEPSIAGGHLERMEQTLRVFATRALAPFRDLAVANVDKLILEFGLNIGGEAGIPYITSGKVESNLKVRVECSFPPARNEPSKELPESAKA